MSGCDNPSVIPVLCMGNLKPADLVLCGIFFVYLLFVFAENQFNKSSMIFSIVRVESGSV